MRVLIMADMEGVSGIVVWDQVNGGAPLYEECRRLYTEEINAAVRGAKAAGATEIVVVDCHGAGKDWTFNSLVPELIDPDCTWVNHHPWSRYTELLETGCDVALMVAMHARAGTPDGVLCHTISTTTWRNLYFNDDLVGEFGINCALCGHYGVPVALITGDEATCREGRALLGEQLARRRRQEGPLPLLRPQRPPGPRPPDDPGRRHRGPEVPRLAQALRPRPADDDHHRALHRRQRQPVPRQTRRRAGRPAQGRQPR